MARIGLAVCGRGAIPALGLLLVLSMPARGDDVVWRQRVLDLDKITGNEVVQGEVNKLLAEPKGSKELIQAALERVKDAKQPMTYNAALVLAQVAAELKDLKSSEIFFRVCTDQAAKMQSTRKLYESYLGLVYVLEANKKFTESVRVCRELLELKTFDGKERIYLLAFTTPKLKDIAFDEREDYNPAQGLRPIFHRRLIKAIARQGKLSQALKLADNLLKEKNDWEELALKGWVLHEAGRLAEAAKTYEDAFDRVTKDKELDKYPEEREDYQQKYRYILSNIYIELNQIDRASEHLQALLSKQPDDPGYLNDLGYIWADHDLKLAEAEKLIRKALELDRKRRQADPKARDKENGAYLDSLGWVLYKQKKFKEAKEILLKAIADKKSQHIEIYDHLGDTHLALGERDLALAAWRKGLEMSGTSRRDQQRRAIVEKKLQMHK